MSPGAGARVGVVRAGSAHDGRVLRPWHTITVTPTGVPFTATWRSVSGATGVEVASASVNLAVAPSSTRDLGTVAGGATDTTTLDITIPGGERALKSLTFHGLSRGRGDDEVPMREVVDLQGRVGIAVFGPSGQPGAPVHTVDPVGAAGARPTLFGGAGFANRVLTLPDLRAAKVRVMRLVAGFPEDASLQPFNVDHVTAIAAAYPSGITVTGPDGATLLNLPGPLTRATPITDVDLRVPLEQALTAAVTSGSPLVATYTVRASGEGDLETQGLDADGAVVRAFADAVRGELEAVPAPLPVTGPPLDQRAPHTAIADVTITYHGLRRHELSDAVPTRSGGIGGPVVGAEPFLRPLPPQALTGERVGRVGLVGRAVGATDLAVRLLHLPAEPLGSSGTISLPGDASRGDEPPHVVWIELPDPVELVAPVALEVRAPRGAFRWAAGADPSAPLVLLAVLDDDPGGRPVHVGGQTLTVTAPKQTVTGQALRAADFASAAPVLTSDLFCTVQLDHLTLRYDP